MDPMPSSTRDWSLRVKRHWPIDLENHNPVFNQAGLWINRGFQSCPYPLESIPAFWDDDIEAVIPLHCSTCVCSFLTLVPVHMYSAKDIWLVSLKVYDIIGVWLSNFLLWSRTPKSMPLPKMPQVQALQMWSRLSKQAYSVSILSRMSFIFCCIITYLFINYICPSVTCPSVIKGQLF